MSNLSCVFIGNCQNAGIIQYLNKSEEFTNLFDVYDYTNWQLIRDKSSIPIEQIKKADLLIVQPLPAVYGCYSTDPSVKDSIGYYANEKCIKINYPYVYSSAFWPIVQAAKGENRWFGGEVIDNLISSGFNLNQIIENYKTNNIDWNYKIRFEQSLNILKEKEKVTDIKVSDYIENNYMNEPLFLIPQHPTSSIFLYMANQILDILNMKRLSNNIIHNINDVKSCDSTYGCNNGMFPIDKSIIDYLNLNFGHEYSSNSEEFYIQRIKDYVKMNYGSTF